MFLRIVLIFICAGILAQSGPLPVCQWDEALGNWTRNMTTASFVAAGNEIGNPASNDTPDEIMHDFLQQQSVGASDSAQSAIAATHLHGSIALSLWASRIPDFIAPRLIISFSPVTFSTAPPSFGTRTLPLLN